MTQIINASAGTGKTHYLVNLIFKDMNGNERTEEQIKEFLKKTVILSFSNAAVDELKRRIFLELIKKFAIEFKEIQDVKDNMNKLPELRVYTIHSFILEFAKVLKYDLGIRGDIELELNEDFSIWRNSCERAFKNEEVYNKMQEILKKIYDDDKKRENVKNFIKSKGKILFLISNGFEIKQIKNENIENCYDELNELNENYEKIFNLCKEIGEKYYLPTMYESGVFEFEALLKIICDFLLRMRQSFGDIERYREWFKDRLKRENFEFENLFVDEAQDNDIMQNFFIYSVIPADINKIIVGDPKQSIYYFRNAVPAQFKKAFAELIIDKEIEKFVLRKSNRIISKKTLDYINKVCETIKNKLSDIWDYNKDIDELVSKDFKNNKEEIEFKNLDSKIEIHNIQNIGKILYDLPKIDEFLSDENKKIGILVRNRKYLYNTRIIEKIKSKDLKNKLKYKLSFELKDELPDYYYKLLKSLIEFANRKNLKKTVMYLYFSNKENNNFLLHYFLSKEIEEIDLVRLLKKIKNEISYIIKNYEKKGIALSLLEIFDGNLENNIWKYYYKENEDIEFKDIVRIINYVVLKIWVEEVEYGFFNTEEAIRILDEINVPFQWFSVQEAFGENVDTSGVIEVTTIHSSKGKTYDKVIIIDNFMDELKDEPDFRMEGSFFKNMFTIKFEKVIEDVPNIKLGLFPYTELEVAKKIKKDEIANGWIKEIYDNIKKDVISQKLNLLYVALTRTKRDILLLGQFGDENILNIFNINPYVNNIINYTVINKSSSKEAEFIILKSNKDLMNLAESFKIYYLRDKLKIKIKDRTDSIFERIKRNKINILVHHILYNIFKEIKSKEEFEQLVEKYGEELKEIDSNIFEKLKNKEIEIFNLEKKKIRTETHFMERNSEGCLKASVELLIYDDKDNLYLTEIKTNFDKNIEEELKKYAEEQLKYYKAMIEKLNKDRNIKINLLTIELI